ncbi:MAG TPA: hypothetical protein EYP86_02155 [Candidatus Altiarchaeales archaeon]|nr:hypothetical protein [Candidatus Altiarchaeales archaeon]
MSNIALFVYCILSYFILSPRGYTPAINIAAIFLTISVLGLKIGLARIVSAILLAILVGISIELIFREE